MMVEAGPAVPSSKTLALFRRARLSGTTTINSFSSEAAALWTSTRSRWTTARPRCGSNSSPLAVGAALQLPQHDTLDLFSANSRDTSEALVVSEGQRNPVAKGIQEVVFPLPVLVADPKPLDLIDQMVSGFL